MEPAMNTTDIGDQSVQHQEYDLTADSFFGPGGMIARAKPDFIPREGQQELSELILRALDERVSIVAEAPTGFGKSFAVLVPSIIAAVKLRKRVVISTETLTLQDQYVQNDLPLLQQACASRGIHFKFAVAKGRGNYVCRAKLDEDNYDGSSAVMAWAKQQDIEKGDTGDQTSIPFHYKPKDWLAVCADEDCERKACPFFVNGRKGPTDCFVYEAQRRFLAAQVIVANHTLVLLDLGQEAGSILGGYDVLIVDEAHSFGVKAQDTWGVTFKPRTVSKTMNLMARMLGKVGISPFETGYMEHYRRLEDAVFEPLQPVIKKGQNIALKQIDPRYVEASKEAAEELIAELRLLNRDLGEYVTREEDDPQTVVIRAAKERISKLSQDLGAVYGDDLDPEWKDNWLVFLETAYNSKKELYGVLNLKPIEVAPLMRRALFDVVPTVVMMSATMRIGNSFDFMRRELGVPETALEFIGESPFDFKENVTGYFPTDLPDDPRDPEYLSALADRILKIIEHCKGSALVLFTNIQHMQHCYDYVVDKVPYVCYLQGEASRAVLLERFKADISSCLFATKTFFTGIDIPGEALSCLILTKAPFAVPTEPMFRARADKIDEAGGNSFNMLSMPMMLFDVRQGFGRLIRTVSDTGFFAFLDSRAMKKAYGRRIVSSLPDMTIIKQITGVAIASPPSAITSRLVDIEEE